MWGITMKINYKLNENSTIRSYAISYDGTGLDIGDYEIKIGCDKIINGNLVKCSDEEYAAYIEQMKARKEAVKRIDELKILLSESDYKALKYAEGIISESEYAVIKTQRQEWRNEINQLQGEYGI